MDSLAPEVLIWSPGHPSCKCRLLCRCKDWLGLEKGWISMDSFHCLKVIQRGAHRHFIEFLFIVCLLLYRSSVMSESWWPHGLNPTRLLCAWDFPGKNIGVGCHFLLQGILLSQGSNLHLWCLLHWRADSLPLSHQGSLFIVIAPKYINKSTLCHLFKLFKSQSCHVDSKNDIPNFTYIVSENRKRTLS